MQQIYTSVIFFLIQILLMFTVFFFLLAIFSHWLRYSNITSGLTRVKTMLLLLNKSSQKQSLPNTPDKETDEDDMSEGKGDEKLNENAGFPEGMSEFIASGDSLMDPGQIVTENEMSLEYERESKEEEKERGSEDDEDGKVIVFFPYYHYSILLSSLLILSPPSNLVHPFSYPRSSSLCPLLLALISSSHLSPHSLYCQTSFHFLLTNSNITSFLFCIITHAEFATGACLNTIIEEQLINQTKSNVPIHSPDETAISSNPELKSKDLEATEAKFGTKHSLELAKNSNEATIKANSGTEQHGVKQEGARDTSPEQRSLQSRRRSNTSLDLLPSKQVREQVREQ